MWKRRPGALKNKITRAQDSLRKILVLTPLAVTKSEPQPTTSNKQERVRAVVVDVLVEDFETICKSFELVCHFCFQHPDEYSNHPMTKKKRKHPDILPNLLVELALVESQLLALEDVAVAAT